MRGDPSNSAGYWGLGPAGITESLGIQGIFNGRSDGCSPAIRELRPDGPFKLSWVHKVGRRMSASTKRTLAPCCAKAAAKLMLVVVLPSCGSALDTSSTLLC